MQAPFRVIDTGIAEGRRNIAFDQALIDAHSAGEIPDTIRFLRFNPTALVGRHQAVGREIHVDYCRTNGIGLARRITGGGSIYFDQGQLGWELVLHRRTLGIQGLPEISAAICEAAAHGLQSLGIDAQFRPRNDIEVEGRKISGTGGFFDGDTLFFQGTLLLDSDPEDMVKALRVPAAKLAKRKLDSAAERVVTLRQLLGDAMPDVEAAKAALLQGFRKKLGIETSPGAVTEAEQARARQIFDDEIGTDEFVWELDDPDGDKALRRASLTTPGGTVTAYVRLTGGNLDRIQQILITGDFFANPPRLVYDLEAALRDVPVEKASFQLSCFFGDASRGQLSISATDIERVILDAAGAVPA